MNKIILIIAMLAKNLLMLIVLLRLKKLRRVLKLQNLKLVIEPERLSKEIFLAKVKLKIDQKNICYWFCVKN